MSKRMDKLKEHIMELQKVYAFMHDSINKYNKLEKEEFKLGRPNTKEDPRMLRLELTLKNMLMREKKLETITMKKFLNKILKTNSKAQNRSTMKILKVMRSSVVMKVKKSLLHNRVAQEHYVEASKEIQLLSF
jgi:hypothetical protein